MTTRVAGGGGDDETDRASKGLVSILTNLVNNFVPNTAQDAGKEENLGPLPALPEQVCRYEEEWEIPAVQALWQIVKRSGNYPEQETP